MVLFLFVRRFRKADFQLYLKIVCSKPKSNPIFGIIFKKHWKREAGETPDECARREILEETHFTVTEMDFKGMITFPEFTPGHDWYTYVFKVTGFEGELISDEESREGTLEWVPYDEVLSKPTWEGDYEIFKWILEDRPFFSAKFSYDRNQNLVDKTVTFYDK